MYGMAGGCAPAALAIPAAVVSEGGLAFFCQQHKKGGIKAQNEFLYPDNAGFSAGFCGAVKERDVS